MMVKQAHRLSIMVLLAILVLPTLVAAGCTATTDEAEQIKEQFIKDITSSEAYTLIQDNKNNDDFIIIDVRTPEEYAAGHIANAVNIDFKSEAFRDELGKLDKNKTYLIYCRSGRRSAGSRDIMEELGIQKVYHMSGGIVDWETEGLPVVK